MEGEINFDDLMGVTSFYTFFGDVALTDLIFYYGNFAGALS